MRRCTRGRSRASRLGYRLFHRGICRNELAQNPRLLAAPAGSRQNEAAALAKSIALCPGTGATRNKQPALCVLYIMPEFGKNSGRHAPRQPRRGRFLIQCRTISLRFPRHPRRRHVAPPCTAAVPAAPAAWLSPTLRRHVAPSLPQERTSIWAISPPPTRPHPLPRPFVATSLRPFVASARTNFNLGNLPARLRPGRSLPAANLPDWQPRPIPPTTTVTCSPPTALRCVSPARKRTPARLDLAII